MLLYRTRQISLVSDIHTCQIKEPLENMTFTLPTCHTHVLDILLFNSSLSLFLSHSVVKKTVTHPVACKNHVKFALYLCLKIESSEWHKSFWIEL